jgi:cytochrome oxidase Cu insertion factor (SCO1/SenC/PrrC family)
MIFTLLVALLVVDDGGRVRSVDEWRGTPAIIAPIYCRCPLACPLIAKGLKRGVAESTTPPAAYRVVLFSMDPRDTPDDLRRFRERHQLPLSWTIVATKNPRPFLDSLGYRYADANGLFAHPNAVIALDRNLKPVKYLFGTQYTGREIDEALAIANGRPDWIGRFGGLVLAVLLLIALLSLVYLMTLVSGRARALDTSMRGT